MSRASLAYIGPQLRVAVGLTGVHHTGRPMAVIDVRPDRQVHGEPPVRVDHGAFKQPGILGAARTFRFDSVCRLKRFTVKASAIGSKLTCSTVSSSLPWTAKPPPIKEVAAGVR